MDWVSRKNNILKHLSISYTPLFPSCSFSFAYSGREGQEGEDVKDVEAPTSLWTGQMWVEA